MNNQEVIMHSALPATGLIAHSKALEAAGIAISLVTRVPAPFKSLADQVVRSASSFTLTPSTRLGQLKPSNSSTTSGL